MADTENSQPASYVERVQSGPLDRPAVLKEICMDILMLQVQSAGILQYLISVAPLPIEAKQEVERLHSLMGNRVDSMINALLRLERTDG